jgi:hypothetical protein
MIPLDSRWLWRLTVLWGAAIFWLAPHPPMIDLPQHAGQIALLRDMLLDQSPWSDLFRINLFTPYLLGYGLALPLSLVIPVTAALKVLLTLAYFAFVLACVQLRRHFDANPRLDWLVLPGFFGFAYHWGFFTFLLAAPIGLWFVLLAEHFSQKPTLRLAVGLTVLGLLLLASHGLVFLFAVAVGGLTLLLRLRVISSRALALTPYIVLTLACIAYFLINRQINVGMTDLSAVTSWNGGLMRIPKSIIYTLTAEFSGKAVALWGAAMLGLLAAPWLLGLRPQLRRRQAAWVPLAVLVGIFTLAPSNAAGTVYLYQRFALFLMPAYSWIFSGGESARRHAWATPLLVALCWAVLGVNSLNTWHFGQESADFQRVIDTMQPGQRALMLVVDPDSPAAGPRVYTHYAAWYQAEKQGLVDFNFAWFPPQIVRYRPDRLPGIQPGFEWHPERFDWIKNHGSDYRYFIARSQHPIPERLFDGADCPPQLMLTSGEWQVFEYRGCP